MSDQIWEPTSSNLPSVGERPISSAKWVSTIEEIYTHLNYLKSSGSMTGHSGEPPEDTRFAGQLWCDVTDGNRLKVWSGSEWLNVLTGNIAVPVERTIHTTAPILGSGTLENDVVLSIRSASTSVNGAVRLANVDETREGVLDSLAVTPFGVSKYGVSWEVVIHSGAAPLDKNVIAGSGYILSGDVNLILPSDPLEGDLMGWRSFDGTQHVLRNGNNIENAAEDISPVPIHSSGMLVYAGHPLGWIKVFYSVLD